LVGDSAGKGDGPLRPVRDRERQGWGRAGDGRLGRVRGGPQGVGAHRGDGAQTARLGYVVIVARGVHRGAPRDDAAEGDGDAGGVVRRDRPRQVDQVPVIERLGRQGDGDAGRAVTVFQRLQRQG